MIRRVTTALALLLSLAGCASTAPFRNAHGGPVETSIASLEPMTLGGQKQWVLIRGENAANPVLLFLHGGPGAPETTLIKHYLGALEKDFVVVSWDQLGGGKSYSDRIPPERLTIDHMVSDGHELVEKLRQRFGKQKILLVGHSWGTVIGTRLARQHPELFHGYVGVAQWTNSEEREALSYQCVLGWAKETGRQDAVRDLERIGSPPYTGADEMKKIEVLKTWLQKSGGLTYGQDNMNLFLLPLFLSSEYTWAEKFNFMNGLMFSMEHLWAEAMTVDLPRTAPKLDLPVLFVSGRHDFNTPLSQIERYASEIEAPQKEHVIFEKSAHSPCYEEPERFVSLIRSLKERWSLE
jgi:pimeloyl-ACP methyl ester carboxylesterase